MISFVVVRQFGDIISFEVSFLKEDNVSVDFPHVE